MKDATGRGLLAYLSRLAAAMQQALEFTRGEVGSMVASVEYLNAVVRTQQAYVGISEAPEWVHLEDLLDDALRMNTPVLEPLRVRLIKEYQALSALRTEPGRRVHPGAATGERQGLTPAALPRTAACFCASSLKKAPPCRPLLGGRPGQACAPWGSTQRAPAWRITGGESADS